MKRYWMFRAGKFAAWAVVTLVVVGLVVMALWNWLMPSLFGWSEIGFWQAVALLALSRLLVGGFRGTWSPGMHWRHRMQERWKHMTPEERERFRTGFRGRCGRGSEPTTSEGQSA